MTLLIIYKAQNFSLSNWSWCFLAVNLAASINPCFFHRPESISSACRRILDIPTIRPLLFNCLFLIHHFHWFYRSSHTKKNIIQKYTALDSWKDDLPRAKTTRLDWLGHKWLYIICTCWINISFTDVFRNVKYTCTQCTCTSWHIYSNLWFTQPASITLTVSSFFCS